MVARSQEVPSYTQLILPTQEDDYGIPQGAVYFDLSQLVQFFKIKMILSFSVLFVYYSVNSDKTSGNLHLPKGISTLLLNIQNYQNIYHIFMVP